MADDEMVFGLLQTMLDVATSEIGFSGFLLQFFYILLLCWLQLLCGFATILQCLRPDLW
jgi:hypothetical protein